MRSIFRFTRHVPVALLTGLTVAWFVACPTTRTFAGLVTSLGEMTTDDAGDGPDGLAAPNPFAGAIHLGIPMTAVEATGLLFVHPSASGSGRGGFSNAAALLAATGGNAPGSAANHPVFHEDTAVVSQNNETGGVSGFVLAVPAMAAANPEPSVWNEVSPRTAELPGLVALCAIGLGLAYGASNDSRQAKRRGRERQRTRGFRRMAAPIYAIEKPLRVRLNAGSERTAEG